MLNVNYNDMNKIKMFARMISIINHEVNYSREKMVISNDWLMI
jgi:hypothetical protein